MKQTVFALISLLLLKSVAFSQDEKYLDLFFANDGTNNSVQLVYQLPRSECARQPQWDPANQELPISIKQLCEAALTNVTAPDFADAKSWKVENIQFQHLPATWSGNDSYPADLLNRWFCILQLQAYGDYKAPDWWSRSKYSVVLLDGTVLKPTRRDNPNSIWHKPSSDSSALTGFVVFILVIGIIGFVIYFLARGVKSSNGESPKS